MFSNTVDTFTPLVGTVGTAEAGEGGAAEGGAAEGGAYEGGAYEGGFEGPASGVNCRGACSGACCWAAYCS